MISDSIYELIDRAIAEDVGTGDLTTKLLIPEDYKGQAVLLAKQDLRICGLEIACEVFKRVDSSLSFEEIFSDGSSVGAGTVFARISGTFRGILTAERVALNFLQRLSGIATKTARMVAIAKSSGIKILDTRKTTPGWRELEKYAVCIGGGVNHRIGLYDQVLIKNNHLDALGGDMVLAMERASKCAEGTRIEVEVRSESELRAALECGATAILLDNMSPESIKHMVSIVRGELAKRQVFIEVSGGITEATLANYLLHGVDAISLGFLTHSVSAVDISLRYV